MAESTLMMRSGKRSANSIASRVLPAAVGPMRKTSGCRLVARGFPVTSRPRLPIGEQRGQVAGAQLAPDGLTALRLGCTRQTLQLP